MSNKGIITLLGAALFLSLSGLVVSLFYNPDKDFKTGYFNVEKVFEEFSLKKELEQDYTSKVDIKKRFLDSLELNLKLSIQKFNSREEFDTVFYNKILQNQEQYKEVEDKINREIAQLTQEYDESIVSQLNQYVLEFGKEHGYDYIFANAGGSLMYANEHNDITDEVISFLNEKYSGG